nr:kinesin-like protein KIN-14B isoform X2 [Ipomoea trifida]GMD03935.1 kinesin-like protein KIN-14B [Ipomoea batatas]
MNTSTSPRARLLGFHHRFTLDTPDREPPASGVRRQRDRVSSPSPKLPKGQLYRAETWEGVDEVPLSLVSDKSKGTVALVKPGTENIKRIPIGEYLTSALNEFDPEQYDSLATISDGVNKLLMLENSRQDGKQIPLSSGKKCRSFPVFFRLKCPSLDMLVVIGNSPMAIAVFVEVQCMDHTFTFHPQLTAFPKY